METIIIGRNGNQCFPIKQSGVSNEHARLTIDGNEWTIEDLGSSNGTFVIDDKGDTIQVSKLSITPDTLILLGPNNANGCTFYARYASDNSFSPIFDLLEERDTAFRLKEEKADAMPQTIRKVVGTISALTFLVSLFLEGQASMNLLRAGTMVSALSAFYNPMKAKKQLLEAREVLFRCPNPACTHGLTSKEVHNRRCAYCKAQG